MLKMKSFIIKLYPDLKKQLKTSKVKENTNFKNEKDRTYDHLHNTYNNRNLDYEIENFNNGEKHFKMIKEIKETESNSQPGTHPGANQTLPNNIIPNQNINFNPKKAVITALSNFALKSYRFFRSIKLSLWRITCLRTSCYVKTAR